MVEPASSNYSNIAAQILLDSAHELLGKESLHRYTRGCDEREAFTLLKSGDFVRSLEQIYGEAGGRGLALRIGRAMFRYSLEQLGEQAGFRSVEYRMLPSPRRVEKGLHSLARMIALAIPGDITVVDEKTSWSWRVESCPICMDYHSVEPCCYLMVGLIQEFASWAGGGRFFQVVETECSAVGAPACVFQIQKKPLD